MAQKPPRSSREFNRTERDASDESDPESSDDLQRLLDKRPPPFMHGVLELMKFPKREAFEHGDPRDYRAAVCLWVLGALAVLAYAIWLLCATVAGLQSPELIQDKLVSWEDGKATIMAGFQDETYGKFAANAAAANTTTEFFQAIPLFLDICFHQHDWLDQDPFKNLDIMVAPVQKCALEGETPRVTGTTRGILDVTEACSVPPGGVTSLPEMLKTVPEEEREAFVMEMNPFGDVDHGFCGRIDVGLQASASIAEPVRVLMPGPSMDAKSSQTSIQQLPASGLCTGMDGRVLPGLTLTAQMFALVHEAVRRTNGTSQSPGGWVFERYGCKNQPRPDKNGLMIQPQFMKGGDFNVVQSDRTLDQKMWDETSKAWFMFQKSSSGTKRYPTGFNLPGLLEIYGKALCEAMSRDCMGYSVTSFKPTVTGETCGGDTCSVFEVVLHLRDGAQIDEQVLGRLRAQPQNNKPIPTSSAFYPSKLDYQANHPDDVGYWRFKNEVDEYLPPSELWRAMSAIFEQFTTAASDSGRPCDRAVINRTYFYKEGDRNWPFCINFENTVTSESTELQDVKGASTDYFSTPFVDWVSIQGTCYVFSERNQDLRFRMKWSTVPRTLLGRSLQSEDDREPWFDVASSPGKVAVFDTKAVPKSITYVSAFAWLREAVPGVLSLSQVMIYPSLFADYPQHATTEDWNPTVSLRFSFSKQAIREKKLHFHEGTKFVQFLARINGTIVTVFIAVMTLGFPARKVSGSEDRSGLSAEQRLQEMEDVLLIPQQSANAALRKVISVMPGHRAE